jgi:hypothetical protein
LEAGIMTTVERDKWYFLVDCIKCDRAAVLGEAPEGIAEPAVTTFALKCPHCGLKQTFQAQQVQRHQGIYI